MGFQSQLIGVKRLIYIYIYMSTNRYDSVSKKSLRLSRSTNINTTKI